MMLSIFAALLLEVLEAMMGRLVTRPDTLPQDLQVLVVRPSCWCSCAWASFLLATNNPAAPVPIQPKSSRRSMLVSWCTTPEGHFVHHMGIRMPSTPGLTHHFPLRF